MFQFRRSVLVKMRRALVPRNKGSLFLPASALLVCYFHVPLWGGD